MPEDGSDRRIAVDLFNEVWALLETPDRTPEQDERMVHAAHGSRLHWQAAGTAENIAVGDWLCSRVYAVLGRAEPAIFHARWCLSRAESEDLPDWIRAEAHEALARGRLVAGETDDAAPRRGSPRDRRHDRGRGRSRRRARRSRDAAVRVTPHPPSAATVSA
jgi:hypothetical protein